jgi:hypothetical protein
VHVWGRELHEWILTGKHALESLACWRRKKFTERQDIGLVLAECFWRDGRVDVRRLSNFLFSFGGVGFHD